jgi:DNA-binding GntR family transcriptional regulator
MDQMEAASERGDAAAMTEWNRRLHFAIYAAAGHPRMVDFIRMLWQSTDAYRSMYYTDAAARERVNAEHRSIVEALRAGDVGRAVAELDRHRGHAVDSLQDRLTEPSGHP